MKINYQEINQRLLQRIESLLPVWVPDGKRKGREYIASSPLGGVGGSFSINTETGIWKDFANPSAKGGDLIALYANNRNLKQHESAYELCKQFGWTDLLPPDPRTPVQASGEWTYLNALGQAVAKVYRYDQPDGKKTFSQKALIDGSWVSKTHPIPRILYNLPKILANPDKQVIIVEGEKAADYLQRITTLPVTTWLGGCNGVAYADWSLLSGRRVVIIPDADAPGRAAADEIARRLLSICSEVKIVNVSDLSDGWDVADSGWKHGSQFFEWLKPRVSLYSAPEILSPVTDSPTQTINNIAVIAPELPEPSEHQATWIELGLPMGAGKRPICNMVSAKRVIEVDNLLAGKVWFDEFYNKIFLNGRQIESHDILRLTYHMQLNYGLSNMDKNTVRDAMVVIARADTRNEPLDWLKALKWDGVDRISAFFPFYYGTDDDEYHRDVGRYLWAGLARRLMEPGCQLNSMVVLQGPQGRFKSTSLAIIGGKWYAVSANEIGTTNFVQSMMGKLILEIGELSSFKKSHIETIKNTLSASVDRVRLPYAEDMVDYPRTCVLAGTTNEQEFLADQTGARRFYPITIESCNIQKLRSDRDQLFAQAYHIAQTNENWWIVKNEAAEQAQEARRLSDPWEELISQHSIESAGINISDGFKTTDISSKILHIDHSKVDRVCQMRIADCLRRAGFKKVVKKNKSRLSTKIWVRSDMNYM